MNAAAARAALSLGHSDARLHRWAAALLAEAGAGGTAVDVGCGSGALAPLLLARFDRYVGCDVVAYPGFPAHGQARFVAADLNRPPYPLEDASADAAVSVETIEHLENPRALVRELARVVRPGGVVLLTTPNQLSLLSKLTLLTRNQFNAFQEAPGLYPAHITALVEEDLRRIARECGLEEIEIRYSGSGRVPFTRAHWPFGLGGRAFSDNVALRARRPRS
ncbi:MAG TPA: methyltransferase domain-containing protein [Myxococcales bacterium]|nr:methyltransferase domain-containing protein [Myxococcales bacterium]